MKASYQGRNRAAAPHLHYIPASQQTEDEDRLQELLATKVTRQANCTPGNLIAARDTLGEIAGSGIAASAIAAGDLQVSGDTVLRSGTQAMTGHLDMDSHYVQNTLDPSNPQGVATKHYVETQNTLRVAKTGDTLTGTRSFKTAAATTRVNRLGIGLSGVGTLGIGTAAGVSESDIL